jgi:hypothetical protein
MHWRRLGLVYGPHHQSSWAVHSALTPTPVVLDDERVRVYSGFRDREGVSRIGWVDVAATCPTRVLGVCTQPALDVGRPGCFDDNGVILGDVVRVKNRFRMYYVGFQLVKGVKFLAFTGLAESADGGDHFTRLSEAPVLDRADEALYIRAAHSALPVNGRWRIWYAAGSDWAQIGGNPYPCYHVCTVDSPDGLSFSGQGTLCIVGEGRQYRLGRPRVWAGEQGFHMLFTYGTLDGDYVPGYAWSPDGISWERDDSRVGIAPSTDGWDSRMLCYLAPIRIGGHWYAFYNGNDFGKEGFGCAVLEGNASSGEARPAAA